MKFKVPKIFSHTVTAAGAACPDARRAMARRRPPENHLDSEGAEAALVLAEDGSSLVWAILKRSSSFSGSQTTRTGKRPMNSGLEPELDEVGGRGKPKDFRLANLTGLLVHPKPIWLFFMRTLMISSRRSNAPETMKECAGY